MPEETVTIERGLDRWGFPVRVVVLKSSLPAPRPKRPLQSGAGSCTEHLVPELRRLCAANPAGHCMSGREIARECRVDHEIIRRIERAALRKVRERLRGRLTGKEYLQSAELLGTEVFDRNH